MWESMRGRTVDDHRRGASVACAESGVASAVVHPDRLQSAALSPCASGHRDSRHGGNEGSCRHSAVDSLQEEIELRIGNANRRFPFREVVLAAQRAVLDEEKDRKEMSRLWMMVRLLVR